MARLCEATNAPISSRELSAFYHDHPEERPLFLKRPGQQLIAAARALHGRVSRIYPVGCCGNRVYYAPDGDPVWTRRFERLCAKMRMAELLECGVYQAACDLIHCGSAQSLARYALAGFAWELEEWIRQAGCAPSPMAELALEHARAEGGIFVQCPQRVISRSKARRFLSLGIQLRQEHLPSMCRHLAALHWPPMSMGAFGAQLSDTRGYLPFHLRALLVKKWTLAGEDAWEAGRILGAGRYGLPTA